MINVVLGKLDNFWFLIREIILDLLVGYRVIYKVVRKIVNNICGVVSLEEEKNGLFLVFFLVFYVDDEYEEGFF